MTKEQLIAEAQRRGIVTGATVEEAPFWYTPTCEFVVPAKRSYDLHGGRLYLRDGTSGVSYRIYAKDQWAEVLTPAASAPLGLQEGYACDAPKQMLIAIAQLGEAMGLKRAYYEGRMLVWLREKLDGCPKDYPETGRLTPDEFVRRMLVTASLPKPIMVDGKYEVKHFPGYITVGCTRIENDIVDLIHKNLIPKN